MRISGCGLPPTVKEVVPMVEAMLLEIIMLLFSALVAVTIIALALIVTLVVIMSK